MKDYLNGLQKTMLDWIAPSITEEDVHGLIELGKGYDKTIRAIPDVLESPTWEQGLIEFVITHRVGKKALNNEK